MEEIKVEHKEPDRSGVVPKYEIPIRKVAVEDTKPQELFNYWLEVMKKNANTNFSPKRKKKIVDRLKDYTFEEIKTAIFNCSNTGHNMGKNDARTLYNDIELICRNSENLERFRDNVGDLSSENIGKSDLEIHNQKVADEWLSENDEIDGEISEVFEASTLIEEPKEIAAPVVEEPKQEPEVDYSDNYDNDCEPFFNADEEDPFGVEEEAVKIDFEEVKPTPPSFEEIGRQLKQDVKKSLASTVKEEVPEEDINKLKAKIAQKEREMKYNEPTSEKKAESEIRRILKIVRTRLSKFDFDAVVADVKTFYAAEGEKGIHIKCDELKAKFNIV